MNVEPARNFERPRLRTGETVELALIRAPNDAWAERIETMLRHKGDPWNWQNSELLRRESGVTATFFLLHRDGVPFSNIMLVEKAGAGILGHVWTSPADRRAGASTILMEVLLEDFRRRGGRALVLGTDFDRAPWHYYRSHGFEPVEPESGYMALYPDSRDAFERAWFNATEAVVEPLDWPHWPAAAPLFVGDFEGVVKIAAAGLIGRRSSEEPLLPLIHEERHQREVGGPGCARVLRDASGSAVLGLACQRGHALWPDTTVVDVYCHPRWWHRVAELLAELPAAAPGARLVAYADSKHAAKCAVLQQAGFVETSRLPRWVKAAAKGDARVDVTVFVRS